MRIFVACLHRLLPAWPWGVLADRAGPGLPPPPPAPPTKVTSVEGITEYRLDNGLQVLLFPDPSRPKVTVNLTVLVGSRHEGYGETGMAHLLEHMVFKGTPDHPDIPGAMKERGAQFNGSTSSIAPTTSRPCPPATTTSSSPSSSRPTGMVNSPIKAEDLATEFSVVRNEFEIGRELPPARALAADDGRRLRMAQLRQVDHRQPHRHRARAGRQPAGLLQEVLPARQRHAGRRRQVRREEGA